MNNITFNFGKFIVLIASIALVIPFIMLIFGAQIYVSTGENFEDSTLGKLLKH